MAGIFEEVRMRENAYANNPQALQQRYAQTQELVDLLALQQVNNEKRAAANQIQASMQTVPNTVRDQLEQEALMSSRNQLLAQIGPGVQQQGQRSMMAQQRQPMRQPMQGVAGMPANNMMKAAQGGIVGYAEGGAMYDEMGRQSTNKNMNEMFETLTSQDPTGPMNPLSKEFAERIRLLEREIESITRPRRKPKMLDIPMKGNAFPTDPPPELLNELNILKEARAKALAANDMASGGIVGYSSGELVQEQPSALQKVRQGVGQGMMDMGSNMQESDQIIKSKIPFIKQMLDKGPAITPQERAELKAEVEQNPGLIGMFGEQLEKLGIYVKGMAGGGIVSFVKGGKAGFPDLNNDGKVTYGDVLKGRGVEGNFDGGQIREALGGLLTLATRTPFTKDGERSNFGKILGRLFGLPDVPIELGRTSDDARRFNMDVIEAVAERDIGGREEIKEEIEEEVMETMSVPTRAEAFGAMFPRAQEAVDEYARNKEMGGIGALRTAGRMQEQRRDRNQAMQDFFGDLASQQAQARQDKARMAAQFILNKDKFNKRTYELDPAMTLEGIEEVGIEGFDRGGIVGFDGTNGSSVVDPELVEENTSSSIFLPNIDPNANVSPDLVQQLKDAEQAYFELQNIRDTRTNPRIRNSAEDIGFLGARPRSERNPNYDPELARQVADRITAQEGNIQNLKDLIREQRGASKREETRQLLGGLPNLSQAGPDTGPPTRAEEFARMFPNAREGVEDFAKKKRLTTLQDAQTERDNIAGTKRLRNIATFLRGMGSGSSTGESLQKGGDALEAAVVAEEKQQAALLNAQLDRMGKMAVAKLAATVDREKILADFKGKITTAEMETAQKTLEGLAFDERFTEAVRVIRDQDLDPLEEQVRIQNLTTALVNDDIVSVRAAVFQDSGVTNPEDLGLE